jgi:FixJ family two-component response regulator
MLPTVAVVDDDFSVRESLQSLIRSAGMGVQVFTSAEQFLSSPHLHNSSCLVLDIQLPGMSGIELHRHLLSKGHTVPVIFITAHASDQESRAQAQSGKAVAYLIKPFEEAELLDALQTALKIDLDQGA